MEAYRSKWIYQARWQHILTYCWSSRIYIDKRAQHTVFPEGPWEDARSKHNSPAWTRICTQLSKKISSCSPYKLQGPSSSSCDRLHGYCGRRRDNFEREEITSQTSATWPAEWCPEHGHDWSSPEKDRFPWNSQKLAHYSTEDGPHRISQGCDQRERWRQGHSARNYHRQRKGRREPNQENIQLQPEVGESERRNNEHLTSSKNLIYWANRWQLHAANAWSRTIEDTACKRKHLSPYKNSHLWNRVPK